MQKRISFPFSAIVSLDKLKLAILINAINPKIGGVLIQGPKGSGKTTAVRGLTDILPKLEVIKGCPFNCNPHDASNMCEKCGERYRKGGKLPIEERTMVVVNLPLGATEDRVIGSIDVEKAIKLGVEALEPGVLAEANQNILYVDEINLLPDHIADDLLDSAATGWNVVEREGISVSHPSRFIFIGTMNPEEGQLRPQLLDRFPLSVSVERIMTVKDRMEVVKRNLEFETDPEGFIKKYRTSQEEMRTRIFRARKILPEVEMPEKLLEAICKTCLDLKVDGMRPDIVISKAACTLVAFENRIKVAPNDILVASELALRHRTREGGFLEPATPEEISKVFMAKVKEVKYVEETKPTEAEKRKMQDKPKGRTMIWARKEASEKEEASVEKLLSKFRAQIFAFLSRISPVFGFGKRLKKGPKDAPVTDGVTRASEKLRGPVFEEPEKGEIKGIPTVSSALKPPEMTEGIALLTKIKGSILAPFKLFFTIKPPIRGLGSFAGKRAETITTLHRGRQWGWKFPQGKPRDIHLPATIRAAARKQKDREPSLETALKICLEDVREKSRLYKAPMTLLFVIDLSGSMVFSIEEAKEAILKLHTDAYRYRDKVGIVALKETRAVVVQHPITNLGVVANKLLGLRISSFTPLAAGMLKAWEVLKEARRRDRTAIPVMVIITDGSANVPLHKSLETGEIREFDTVGIAVRKYEDLAVKDVISVSKIIKKEGIYTVVVNTNPHYYGRETYGFAVTKIISSITNGSHHQVGRLTHGKELVERIFEGITEDQRKITHEVSLSPKSS
ncbi:MAG: VWA domain-containing protein [Candidatus Bathyarchaeota archaeon]|nr:VWA domain-containing protein [Candidatus Bathyarchaeota archaeon]MDH5733216.1 VWA domain-containing protein [Candidatus Bathyarchaeota archaeon]